MYDELVKRLRTTKVTVYKAEDVNLLQEAADAIEELQQQAEHYHGCMNEWFEAAQEYKADMLRWIPVTERLPDGRHDVLVYAGVLFPYIAVGYYDGLWKFSFDDSEIAGGVDCWMPLPTPPKEE